eukprot:179981-Pyramimonas_sp.AAC.1
MAPEASGWLRMVPTDTPTLPLAIARSFGTRDRRAGLRMGRSLQSELLIRVANQSCLSELLIRVANQSC